MEIVKNVHLGLIALQESDANDARAFRVVEVNHAAAQILGITSEDLVGRALTECPKLPETGIESHCRQVIRSGKARVLGEIRYGEGGARTGVYAVTVFPLLNSCVGVALENVTERKRAEEALGRLASFPDRNPNPVIETNSESVISYVNPAALKRFPDLQLAGAEHATLKGLPRVVAELSSTGKDYVEREVVVGDLIYEQQISFIPEADRVRIYCLDITERKRADVALRASEERYRMFFERNLAGAFRATLDGRVLDCNGSFARILGYGSREEVMAHTAWDLAFRRAEGEAFVRRLREKKAINNYEACFRRKNGSPVWALLNGSLIGEKGGPPVLECTIIDVTELKRAEAALRQLSGRLLQLQDEERRRMARELHDSTGQILTALTMKLGVLRRSVGTLDLKASKALSESLALAQQCSREVRTFSYLLHPPLLDEDGLASALGWYVEGFTGRSGINVELNVAPELGRLSQELETTLFRVVQESLTNIHRHSGSRRAAIRLVRNGAQVRLEVKDEGRGVDAHLLDEVNRGVATLGVGICGMRERVRQLGGELQIESSSRGTTVSAVLPTLEERHGSGSHCDSRRS